MNGQRIRSIVHNARPAITPRSSFTSSGRMEAAGTVASSGERKEDILQSSRSKSGARAQLFERTRTANSAAGEQYETIAYPLGIHQLMNGDKQRAPARRRFANELHHVPRLPEIEAVERLVHQEQRLRREQRESQRQAPGVSLRQCGDSLAQHG